MQIQTKYFVTLDDDFEFTENTKLEKFLQVIANHPVSIVAGSLSTKENPYYDYAGKLEIKRDDDSLRLLKGNYGLLQDVDHADCKLVDIVLNFFIAGLSASYLFLMRKKKPQAFKKCSGTTT